MCHPDEWENMPLVDKTWGIMPPSGRCLLCLILSVYLSCQFYLLV